MICRIESIKHMKKIIFASLSFLLLFGTSTLHAQGPDGEGRQGRRGQFRRNIEPEKMAERQTERMTEQLDLSASQQEEVYALNLKYAEKQKAILAQREDMDRMAMMNKVQMLTYKKDKELKKLLTKKQFKKYKKIRAKQMEERRQRFGGQGRPGGGPGGPGGPGGI